MTHDALSGSRRRFLESLAPDGRTAFAPDFRRLNDTYPGGDTHPTASRSGRKVVCDSPHRGGRQVYLADISAIVG